MEIDHFFHIHCGLIQHNQCGLIQHNQCGLIQHIQCGPIQHIQCGLIMILIRSHCVSDLGLQSFELVC